MKKAGDEVYTYSENETLITRTDKNNRKNYTQYNRYEKELNVTDFSDSFVFNEYTFKRNDEQQVIYCDMKSNMSKYWIYRSLINVDYDSLKRVSRMTWNEKKEYAGKLTESDKFRAFRYDHNNFVISQNEDGIKTKYYYYFFRDDQELLNIYRLECESNSRPENGYFTHYVFDQNANITRKLSQDFKTGNIYFSFKDYEYYAESTPTDSIQSE